MSSCRRSRGISRWTPFEARTWNLPRSPTMFWMSSVQTPVALITWRARTLMLLAGVGVPGDDAGHPLALAQEADDGDVVGDRGAVVGGGAGDGHRVAGVVDLGVVVLEGADHRVVAHRRRDPHRLALGEVTVPGHSLVAAAERVVEDHPGADVGRFPALLQREEEGDGADQVRGQRLQQEAALAQRLADQAEVYLLEVAEPAVDQLARARRGPGGVVARLQQRHREAARGGVERRSRSRSRRRRSRRRRIPRSPIRSIAALPRLGAEPVVGTRAGGGRGADSVLRLGGHNCI